MTRPRPAFVADVAAVVFGLVTAVVLAGELGRSYDFDESFAIDRTISRGSVVVPLTETEVFNTHPLFSAGQSLWWALGGDGEAAQRLLPVVYGAVAVAVLVGWTSRRLGVLPGVAAGAVLMLNPMFVAQARAVRGYSLAVLGVVVAVVALVEYVRREQTEARSAPTWLLVLHAIGIVAAMGTHVYSGIALGAVGLGSLIVVRRFDGRLWAAWVAAGIGVGVVYSQIFEALRATAEARGTDHKPWFGRLVTWEVLGRDRVTSLVVAAIAVVGIVSLVTAHRHRRVAMAALVVPVLVVAQAWLVWQVVEPFDLYPRFFLTVVPLIALAVAVGVDRVPSLGLVLAVGLVFTVGNVVDERRSVVPIREVADVVHAASELGLETCAVGGRSMGVYGASARELDAAAGDGVAELSGCDVFVRIGGWGRPLREPARTVFLNESRVGGFEVFSDVDPSELGL